MGQRCSSCGSSAKADWGSSPNCVEGLDESVVLEPAAPKHVTVRPRPTRHTGKFVVCTNQLPCPRGDQCTFAHSEEELALWNGASLPASTVDTLCEIVVEHGGRLNPAQLKLLYDRVDGSRDQVKAGGGVSRVATWSAGRLFFHNDNPGGTHGKDSFIGIRGGLYDPVVCWKWVPGDPSSCSFGPKCHYVHRLSDAVVEQLLQLVRTAPGQQLHAGTGVAALNLHIPGAKDELRAAGGMKCIFSSSSGRLTWVNDGAAGFIIASGSKHSLQGNTPYQAIRRGDLSAVQQQEAIYSCTKIPDWHTPGSVQLFPRKHFVEVCRGQKVGEGSWSVLSWDSTHRRGSISMDWAGDWPTDVLETTDGGQSFFRKNTSVAFGVTGDQYCLLQFRGQLLPSWLFPDQPERRVEQQPSAEFVALRAEVDQTK